ncbi:MAG TPA: hypothetical protein VJ835_01110, partial [Fimbriimonadaceae bacterium]|nr:hypothetical protein [Fimbriimonadaceae bacterium]
KDLPAKLRGEAPGILNFMIQGFNLWRETGLIIPPSIQEHVLEFESQNDSVGDWLAELCEINTARKTRSSELFQSYTDYCKRLRIARALKLREFKARLDVEPGIELRSHGNVPTWKGIGLIDQSTDFAGVYRG